MNRRSFFKFLGAGAATLALSEAIPFGRVWSFPSKIVVPENPFLTFTDLATLEAQYLAPAAWKLAEQIDARVLLAMAVKLKDLGPVGNQISDLLAVPA
jgi:hypothetical protein